jgi:hypothetical protein
MDMMAGGIEKMKYCKKSIRFVNYQLFGMKSVKQYSRMLRNARKTKEASTFIKT